jgi:energy-coupling factor transport system substrate-specific component
MRTREDSGLSPAVARIARTTVYDCFRTGRTRVNVQLIGEIVQALTGDAIQAEQWKRRALAARQAHDAATTPSAEPPKPTKRSVWVILGIVCACVVANFLLFQALEYFFNGNFPLYMDMICVAVASVIFGTPWGMLSAVMFTAIQVAWEGPGSWAFVFVSLSGALAWGLGVHRFNMGKNLARFALLNVLTGVVCSLVAVLVIFTFYSGDMKMSSAQTMMESLITALHQVQVATFFTNLLVSLPDKLISGFIALILAQTLLRSFAPPDLVAAQK